VHLVRLEIESHLLLGSRVCRRGCVGRQAHVSNGVRLWLDRPGGTRVRLRLSCSSSPALRSARKDPRRIAGDPSPVRLTRPTRGLATLVLTGRIFVEAARRVDGPIGTRRDAMAGTGEIIHVRLYKVTSSDLCAPGPHAWYAPT
jgi:hypothetical protein